MSGDRGDEAIAGARTLGEALSAATERLRAASATETPQLDAQVLLAHVIGAGRATLLAYPERTLPPEQAATYAMLVARRAAGEPVAYLTGHREFMGLDLLTDRRALIPRPETELLVEAALAEVRARLARGETPDAADVGTGSGAIAVALAALEPRLPRIYATDVSSEALALAADNAGRLGVAERVTIMHGDLLDPLPRPVDLLLANLPYVAPRASVELPPSVRGYEPALALYGSDEGLGHIRRLFAQAPEHLRPGATLFVEFGYDQRSGVVALAEAAFPGAELRVGTDYAGWDRYAIVRTKVASR
ncbi:MAG TPA: peptide chain release factor N(5)-glutamine methyltransferase [Ktedonobacterales bacterium]